MGKFWSKYFKASKASDSVVGLAYRGWLQVAAIFVMAFLALGSVQFSKFQMVGIDSFYHTSVAELIRQKGTVESLPWVSASVYSDRYADTEVMFHAMLIPFLGREKRVGPKIFTVLLSSLILALLAWVMMRHGLPWSWLWISLVIGAGVALTFRLNLTRPHLLSLLLTILFAHFLLSRNALGLLAVSIIFPLAYIAAHLLVVYVAVYFLACLLSRQRPPWIHLLIPVMGIAVGSALNPYRANWPYIWWVLNVGDLTDLVLKAAVPVREFIPPTIKEVILGTGLILPALLIVSTSMFLKRSRPGLRTIFLSLLTVAFFILYLHYQRFVIYWVLFGVLAMASAAADAGLAQSLKNQLNRHHRLSVFLISLGISLVCLQMVRSVVSSQTAVEAENTPKYVRAAQWMNRQLSPSTKVFTCQWDSTPFLIYYAPGLRYINVLSPNFMIAYDKDLYETWLNIRDGHEPDAMRIIPIRFHSNWLFIEKDKTPGKLLAQALSSPKAKLMYEDYESAIFRLENPHARRK